MEHYCRDTTRKEEASLFWRGLGLLAVAPLLFRLGSVDPVSVELMVATFFAAILGVILLFMGIHGLIHLERSSIARSIRRYLPAQEQDRPVDELFELVDQDLNRNGVKLLNGTLIVGREWLFAEKADACSPMPVDRIYGAYLEKEKKKLSLSIADQLGNVMCISKLTLGQVQDVFSYLNARVPQLVVWEKPIDMRTFCQACRADRQNTGMS